MQNPGKGTWRERAKRNLGRAEGWLMPPRLDCVICHDPRRADPATGICPDCMAALMRERVPASACPRCLSRMPARKGCAFCAAGGMKGLSGAYAPFWYHPASRQLILAVKFGGNSEPVQFLGQWMSDTLTDRDFDMIVPVPLHRRRLRYRGVNQAALLAAEVSRRTGIPLREDVLERVRATRPQTALRGKKQRGKNVKDAFQAAPGALKGVRVLLCDDVRTTGATARACAAALSAAGCEKVGLITGCCAP